MSTLKWFFDKLDWWRIWKHGPTFYETKFKEISAAYEILSDVEKRKTYDLHGIDAVQQGAGGANPFDIFSNLFGGGRGGNGGHGMGGIDPTSFFSSNMNSYTNSNRRRARDRVEKIQVTTTDIFIGKELFVNVTPGLRVDTEYG